MRIQHSIAIYFWVAKSLLIYVMISTRYTVIRQVATLNLHTVNDIITIDPCIKY